MQQRKLFLSRPGKPSQIVSDWGIAPGKAHDFLANAPVGAVGKHRLDRWVLRTRAADNKRPLAQVLNNLRLRAYWDGDKEAAIDVPLLSAGDGQRAERSRQRDWRAAKRPFRFEMADAIAEKSQTRTVQRRTRFHRRSYQQQHLRIARGATSHVAFSCARSGSSRTEMDKPLSILKADSEGAFVGLNLDIRPAASANRRTFAFLEGNETVQRRTIEYSKAREPKIFLIARGIFPISLSRGLLAD